jgi:hypothetical protein
MSKYKILCAAFAVFLSMTTQPLFAGGGDRSVTTSSYVDSEGNRGVVITNQSARDMNRYIRQSQDGRYVYKNYTHLSPQKASGISSPASQSHSQAGLRTPYTHYDASFIANCHRIMEPIVIPCPGMGNVDITPIIIKEAQEHNIDPLLIKTVIKFESGFCASAVSPAGACGLMQLMPDTASGLGVGDVFNPYENIAGGVHYIRRQLDNFNNNVAHALAAYNAGPGAVQEYGGVPPFEETQNYVRMIMADYLGNGRVARRTALPAPSEKAEAASRKIDVISTLSRMKGESGQAAAGSSGPATQITSGTPSPEIIPISSGSRTTTNLLENRSAVQGNPLENRSTVSVPGY